MKKTLSKILIILNSIIVVSLLFISVAMFFFSSSQRDLFGYSALLFTTETTESDASRQTDLLLLQKNSNSINIGDTALYIVRDEYNIKTQFVDTITDITNGSVSFEHSSETVSITSDLFGGKVVVQNKLFGNFLYALINTKSMLFLCVGIISGFFVISIGLIILLTISERKKKSSLLNAPLSVGMRNDNGETPPSVTGEITIQKPTKEFAESQAKPVGKKPPESPRPATIQDIPKPLPNKPAERHSNKSGTVLPNALSPTKLSKANPLYDSHRNFSVPPKNIGTAQNTSDTPKPPKPAVQFTAHNSIHRSSPLQTGRSIRTPEKTSTVAKEDDLFAFYEMVQQTHELDFDDVVEKATGTKQSVKTEPIAVKPPASQGAASMPAVPAPSETDKKPEMPSVSSFNIDDMLNDIVSHAAEDFYKTK